MWLKLRTLIVTGMLSLAFISSAYAETEFVKELKNLDTKKESTALFQKLMSIEPFQRLPDPAAVTEINETLDWLRLRGFYDNDSSRFTYAYATWLWMAGVKDSATAMYFFAGIKARSDGARCADKTSPQDRTAQYQSLLADPIAQFLQTQSKGTKEQIYKLATMGLDERLPLRQPDEWLCNGGMQFFQKYAAKHGDLKGREVESSGGLSERTIIVEDDSIKPDFIADAAWQIERRASQEAALTSLRKLLLE